MGSKQSKIEDAEYLPATPTLNKVLHQPISVETEFEVENLGNPLDPRSPLGCRTPISQLYEKSTTLAEQVYQQEEPVNFTENPMGILRKRFFKGFSYSLRDPRSPSLQLNRTPLVFNDLNDKSLNLDDTFSDLFVETKVPPTLVADIDMIDNIEATALADTNTSDSGDIPEESSPVNMKTPDASPIAPVAAQQCDPRSPSIGVDRTPIIFNDDADANEEDMIESILAKLSLNLSNASGSSIVSICGPLDNITNNTKPENKPLERVRCNVGKKKKITKKNVHSRRNRIYEDRENFMTPKAALNNSRMNNMESGGKRTPLSCVKNCSHLRSRSVENSAKSLKTSIPLNSFDDSLNVIKFKDAARSPLVNLENSYEI